MSKDSDWSQRLALRIAQIVNESEPGELIFIVIKREDGAIELRPPSPRLERLGKVTAVRQRYMGIIK